MAVSTVTRALSTLVRVGYSRRVPSEMAPEGGSRDTGKGSALSAALSCS